MDGIIIWPFLENLVMKHIKIFAGIMLCIMPGFISCMHGSAVNTGEANVTTPSASPANNVSSPAVSDNPSFIDTVTNSLNYDTVRMDTAK